jgi:hypothetical protein
VNDERGAHLRMHRCGSVAGRRQQAA